ncbi:MAG TPA: 3-carboxy-cis,cis-muconate cycloisomerase [Xanthobacteraceae bacterium]|nr:3-carboxy-cis,cis-muconate cycloisomerase [Xanthobacteraceae bacterium]
MATPPPSLSLLAPLVSSAAMRAVLDDRARLQRMLDVEAALARAEADAGVIPASAAAPIAAVCKAERFDLAAIGEQAATAGNVAIPLVKALTAEVAKVNAEAAKYVHWGATSQDIIDTALVLELRAAADALLSDIGRSIDGFSALATRYRKTDSVARTLMQQALPMPFGLKLAGYAAALARSRHRLRRVRQECLVLQFGGAAGTLSALGSQGMQVSARLAALLDLPLPDASWHSHHDRLADVASAFAILTGTCGKIARDVALLMQTEVAEVFEPAAPGRGGSSTMPHKRNPVYAATALAAADLAPQLAAAIFAAQVQENERALGGWQAEWQAFPALALVASGAMQAIADIAQGMEIDPARMRANLDLTHGLVMAEAVSMVLAGKLGKAEAHALVEEASKKAAKEKRNLQDVLAQDKRVTAHLPAAELANLFEPAAYQGVAQAFIDRLIASSKERGSEK